MSSRTPDSETTSSPELLRRFITADDQAAFAALVRRHGGWMQGAALHMTGSADMSGEVIQEAFALLARKRPRCPTEAAFTSWLHRTVVFTARNHMAKERRRTRLLHRFSQQYTAPAAVPDGFSEEALHMLDTAIQELPGADRDLILSRYMRRQSWDDLSIAAGRSADAVRKHVERVLEKMAARLRGPGALLPAGALMTLLTDQSSAAPGAAQAASMAASACAAASRLSLPSLLSHTLVTMNTSKAVAGTVVICGLLFSVPLTILSRRATAAEAAAAAVDESVLRAKPGMVVAPEKSTAAAGTLTTAVASGSFVPPPGAAGFINKLSDALGGIAAAARGPADAVNEPLVNAVKAVMADSDRARRTTGLSFLLQWMRAVDVPAVRKAMADQQLPGVLYVNEGNAFRERWATLAGKEAMLDYTKGRTDNAYNRLHSSLVRGWASTDPDGLKEWLDSLPPTCDWKERAGPDLLEGLVRGDPAKATTAILTQDARVIGAMLPRIADSVMQSEGLDGLETWMRTLPANSDTAKARADVAFRLVEGRAFANPDAAIASLHSFESEPWGGQTMARQLGERFGKASQERALDMLERMPVESDLALSLSTSLFTSLAKNQPNAAAAWLNDHKDSPYADQAADALARAVRSTDPSGAQAWARTIRDESRRNAVLKSLEPSKKD